jgi:hypothetical protein
LGRYRGKSWEAISKEDLRQYLLVLRNENRMQRNTMALPLCGVKACFERTLQRRRTVIVSDRGPEQTLTKH